MSIVPLVRLIVFVVAVVAVQCVHAAPSVLGKGPLRVDAENPRYFTNDAGRPILLAGSHTWLNLQDGGRSDPPPEFNYVAWLDFLDRYHHNFFRLYRWEEANWTLEIAGAYRFSPMPYVRIGGDGVALDGKPKFDLTRFDQTYFDRLRARVLAAGQRGIYVSIMLFNGWSVASSKGALHLGNPWNGHPYNRKNNINGLDGDPNGDGSGAQTHTLRIPAVTAYQEQFVKKVVDTVNDLDNVLYEISNESGSDSEAWQYHMIDVVKSYERSKPKQHPVGMTVEWPNGSNDELYASPADWISPNDDGTYMDHPSVADGRKVIVLDTDHLGTQDIAKEGASWVWKAFLRGHNPIFMDQYDGAGIGVGANSTIAPEDSRWVSLRRNLGYVRRYADRINLETMTPNTTLCSSSYCLVSEGPSPAEYLVYSPGGRGVSVDLSATPGVFEVEWFDPAVGRTVDDGVLVGGARRILVSPFRESDAVLYLKAR